MSSLSAPLTTASVSLVRGDSWQHRGIAVDPAYPECQCSLINAHGDFYKSVRARVSSTTSRTRVKL